MLANVYLAAPLDPDRLLVAGCSGPHLDKDSAVGLGVAMGFRHLRQFVVLFASRPSERASRSVVIDVGSVSPRSLQAAFLPLLSVPRLSSLTSAALHHAVLAAPSDRDKLPVAAAAPGSREGFTRDRRSQFARKELRPRDARLSCSRQHRRRQWAAHSPHCIQSFSCARTNQYTRASLFYSLRPPSWAHAWRP